MISKRDLALRKKLISSAYKEKIITENEYDELLKEIYELENLIEKENKEYMDAAKSRLLKDKEGCLA